MDWGPEFVRAIRKAIDGLSADPLLYRVRHPNWKGRWFFPLRFPYRIVYRVDGNLVRRRRPGMPAPIVNG